MGVSAALRKSAAYPIGFGYAVSPWMPQAPRSWPGQLMYSFLKLYCREVVGCGSGSARSPWAGKLG